MAIQVHVRCEAKIRYQDERRRFRGALDIKPVATRHMSRRRGLGVGVAWLQAFDEMADYSRVCVGNRVG